MSIRVFLCALLVGFAGAASAQAQQPAPAQPQTSAKAAAPQLTAEQRVALEKQNQVLSQYAESIAQMVDNGQEAKVWENLSEVAKKSTPEKEFVNTVTASRAKLGKVTSRKLAAITRTVSKGGTLPEGYYVNVNFATVFGSATKPVRELVSFHLDNDKKWRLSGYNVQ
jgi:hypothetical protein